MNTKYTLTINNNSKNDESFSVYQKLPEQPKNRENLAWFSKATHPGVTAEIDWNTKFEWSDQGTLKPVVTAKLSRIMREDCEEASAKPDSTYKIQPKYYAAFGDFKEGDLFDVTILEHTVELSKDGNTIIINQDNSICIENRNSKPD